MPFLGPAATPPTYDQQRGTYTPLTIKTRVNENAWVTVNLPAGEQVSVI